MAQTPISDEVESKKPSFLDKQRAQRPWFDHLMGAANRYQDRNGDYFAAGATYFSVLALFPILMVAFAALGFVLANNPDLLNEVRDRITDKAQGGMGDTLKNLVDQAIASRTTIGVIGLLGALYSGLGWMANLRNALTVQWGSEPEGGNFLKTKLSDLAALIGLFLALVVSFALSALAGSSLTTKILDAIGLGDVPGVGVAVRIVSVIISIGASWVLFTWVIAKLPRVKLPVRNAMRAGLLTAVVFEIFKYIATFYLAKVTSGPAGATFGPIIGIMVFGFITTRIVLFATAWAATDPRNAEYEPAPVPDPVIISPRVAVRETPSPVGVLAAVAAGALAAVGLSSARRRK
ncbi:inner membrane protein YhjD [Williamsia sterculiae]|uniref:Membrane protein n=1 Tax=Williamsia sterculiae TaxID=1344003 RepID=A0A1N7DWK4_9NOCA|nr:inner membrane protein YhjD [Williamsia sterculiae]SIR80222.1 membrane protein [Williamsia sterculiae]